MNRFNRRYAVISVRNVRKKFSKSITGNRKRILREMRTDIFNRPRTIELQETEFWSLKDISFDLRKGESLGIIGHNGAGKSTLLRLLARHINPDFGTIHVEGDVAELMYLTAGLEDNLSGLENIYIAGALRGISHREVEDRLEQIIEFSELDDFLHARLSSYSKGMRLRLAFSVAVHTSPDILLIDEILSVGDFAFKQKCIGKMQELQDDCAIIFVSHSLSQIKRFCSRCIVLDRGEISFSGDPVEAIRHYYALSEQGQQKGAVSVEGPTLSNADFITLETVSWEDKESLEDAKYDVKTHPVLNISYKVLKNLKNPSLNILLYSEDGQKVAAFKQPRPWKSQKKGSNVNTSVKMNLRKIVPGNYKLVITLADHMQTLHRGPGPALTLVAGNKTSGWGVAKLPATWDIQMGDKNE